MKNNMLSKLILAALTATLTVSMASCAQNAVSESSLQPESVEQQQVVSAAGTLLLSVNPEIEVEYDKQGLVLEIEGLNDDGKSVISQYQDYQGKACAEVVRELVQQIHQGGYFENQLAGHTRNIVVKLEDGSVCPNGEFLEEVADGVREAVNQIGISSVPMMVGTDDLDDQGRIGTAKARELALNQMGLTDAVFSEGEYELDDGIYELEFTADGVEYEYEVDAITGKVLEADYDRNDDWHAWNDDDQYDDDWDDQYDDDWDDQYDDDWDDEDDQYDDDWDDEDDQYDDDWDDDDDQYDDDWDDEDDQYDDDWDDEDDQYDDDWDDDDQYDDDWDDEDDQYDDDWDDDDQYDDDWDDEDDQYDDDWDDDDWDDEDDQYDDWDDQDDDDQDDDWDD